LITLDEPTVMKAIKIEHKDPVNFFFGIYRIDAYAAPYAV